MEPVPSPGSPDAIDRTDWSAWSVVLLKPDCVERGLTEQVLARLAQRVTIVAREVVTVTEAQIFAHYDDLIDGRKDVSPIDPATALRSLYVGKKVMIALAHGPAASSGHPGTPAVLRSLLGHFDPAQATSDSIRGYFGTDSLTAARAEGRLIDNLIHTSDDPSAARRDFLIWFGPERAGLLDDSRRGQSTEPGAQPGRRRQRHAAKLPSTTRDL